MAFISLRIGMFVVLMGLFMTMTAVVAQYNEAPSLRERVEAGELPPVEERLPAEPVVIEPYEEIGLYGGTLVAGHAPNHEYLLMLNRTATETIPNIAKGWEFSEDGTSFTLHLREGLKWSDGVEFTVDDMMFWYEDVLQNPDLTATIPSWIRMDDALIPMVKVDDYTVRLDFPRPYYGFISMLNSSGFRGRLHHGWARPAHFFKEFHINYNPNADELAREKGFDHWWQLFALYNDYSDVIGREAGAPDFAAWSLKERTPSGDIYERNPYYFKVDSEGNQLPYIDRVLITLQDADAQTRLLRMLSGEIQFNSWGTAIGDFPVLKANEADGNYRVWVGRDLWAAVAAYGINQTFEADPALGELLRNKQFRQALSLAIDREEINEVVVLGQGIPRQATFHPDLPGYREAWGLAYAEHDPERANQLLDEIGLDRRGAEGWRLRPDGSSLTLVIPVSNAIPFWIPITELVRDYWRAVGIRTEMRTMDTGALLNFVESNEAHVFVWVFDNAHPVSVIGSQGSFLRPSFWLGPYGPGWATWLNSDGTEGIEPPSEIVEIDRLARTLPYIPPEEQEQILAQMAELHAENVYLIGTVGMAGKPVVAHVDLGNVSEEAIADNADIGGNRNQWMEEFYWKSAARRGE